MKNKDINQLFEKFLRGSLSKEKRLLLISWIKRDDQNLEIFKNFINQNQNIINQEFDDDAAFQQFYSKIQARKKLRKKRIQSLSIAASIVFMTFLGYQFNNIFSSENLILQDLENREDVSFLQITHSKGIKNIIRKESNEQIINDFGKIIADKNQRVLSFHIPKNSIIDTSMISIDIPYGEKYKLVLNDKTIVWMNSGSSIKFPQQFSKKSRNVYLTGEAYFDVSQDKNHPFIVNTSNLKIKVLGTHFNVSNYREDEKILITLIEGAVTISENHKNTFIKLSDDQQAIFSKSKKTLKKKNVNAKIFKDWIDDKLIINKLKFSEIIKKLERRYNVVIENRVLSLENKVYQGEFVDESLIETIQTISLSADINYTFNKNKIILTNNK